MSTLISEFREAVRSLIGDLDTPSRYEDAALDAVVRTVLQTGRVEDYELESSTAITPAVTEVNDWFLIAAQAALIIARGRPDAFSWGTRDFSQRVSGASRLLVLELGREIRAAEGRSLFRGWQDFGTWLQGMDGVRPAWRALVAVNIRAPLETLQIP